jgi:hypothetical protein
MAPTRAPVALNGILRARQKLLVLFGALCSPSWDSPRSDVRAVADVHRHSGSLSLDVDRRRVRHQRASGSCIIQTLNPVKVLEMGYRLWMTRYPGVAVARPTRRRTAPHQPIPPELWPLLPPRLRAHEIAKADKAAADDGPKHLDGA